MPLNFPTSPIINDTYTYQSTIYTYDGSRWVLSVLEYSYSGENKSSNTSIVTLDLSKGNVFNIEPIVDIISVEFTNAPSSVQSFTVKVGGDSSYTSYWDLATASYDNISFFVGGQDSFPFDVFFKPDGTKMYMVGVTNDRVYQYTLSTPWNVSTATYDNVSFLFTSQDATPKSIFFHPDGTKMYMLGTINDRVYQYTLSTPWSLATASYDNVSFLVSGQDTNPDGVFFHPDGTKMYMVGRSNARVYQYTLSTPWNLSTASYDNISFFVGGQDTAPREIFFKPDGTKMYMVGAANDRVYQYALSTPWSLATASYDNISFLVSSQETNPWSISFKPDGTKMYILGGVNYRVYQYTLSTSSYIDWPENITWENGTTAPAAPAPGSNSVYYFITADGGTTYYGKLIKEDVL